ncbi:MAG TPA: hypothetical protein VGK78_11030 [Nocardioides sp.]|uniref:hypothetical protein n=1 Tax=Nocardioides sp. TaxID=35761 RepID=UPI002F3F24E8
MLSLLAELLFIVLFLGGVFALLFFLEWLERPHRWMRSPQVRAAQIRSRPAQYAASRASTRPQR